MDIDEIQRIFRMMEKLMDEQFNNQSISFGRGNYNKKSDSKEDERFLDMFIDDKKVYFTIELRGVEKEDLKVTPKAKSIKLKFGEVEKEFKLPCRVNPKSAKVKFNNGILDVTINRSKNIRKKK